MLSLVQQLGLIQQEALLRLVEVRKNIEQLIVERTFRLGAARAGLFFFAVRRSWIISFVAEVFGGGVQDFGYLSKAVGGYSALTSFDIS